MTNEEIANLIKRRRFQVYVHSYLYYERDVNIISDAMFDSISHELADLQQKYPDISKQVEWYNEFKDYDGSTGAFLPFNNQRIINIANRLLAIQEQNSTNVANPVTKKPKKKMHKLF